MTQTFLPGNTRQRIQDLIRDNKMTQADLAKKIGLSESTLSRFLQGKTRNLGDGYIIKIAKIFHVSTDFLLGETDIPDRKYFDIAELGLSAETAKLLYTGKVDTKILNQLVENPRFPQLLLLLGRYQDETMMTGINSMNQLLTFSRSLLLGQAKAYSDDALDAKKAAEDVSLLRTPPVAADINTLQAVFLQIVHDIKQGQSPQAQEQKTATTETLESFRKELSKDESAVNLRSLTEADLTASIIHVISAAGIPEDVLSDLSAALLNTFSSMKVSKHDK